MTLNKYFYATTLSYLAIFLSPLLANLLHFSATQMFLFTTIIYLLGASLLLFFSTQLKEIPAVEARQPRKQTWFAIIAWGIGGIFLAIFAQGLAAQLEAFLFNSQPVSENTQQLIKVVKSYPFYAAAIFIGGPIMEELVFRRALIGVLSQKIPPLAAAIISSLLFALAHNDGHLFIYTFMGLVFYFLYQKTGSIWTPIIAHCSMNLLVVIVQVLMTA